jgi:hypothetical protein
VELSPNGDMRQEMKVHTLMRTLKKGENPYHFKHHDFTLLTGHNFRMKQNYLINLAFYHIALIFHRPAKFH